MWEPRLLHDSANYRATSIWWHRIEILGHGKDLFILGQPDLGHEARSCYSITATNNIFNFIHKGLKLLGLFHCPEICWQTSLPNTIAAKVKFISLLFITVTAPILTFSLETSQMNIYGVFHWRPLFCSVWTILLNYSIVFIVVQSTTCFLV